MHGTGTARTRNGSRGAAGVLAALALVMLAAPLTGCGSDDSTSTQASTQTTTTPPVDPAPPSKIDVGLAEFTVKPSSPTVAAGKVTFTVKNVGKVKHEFVVVRTEKKAADLLKGEEADETGAVGEIGDLPAGSTKTLKLGLKAGHYAMLCNLPGHYKAGQSADLTVK